MLVLDDSVSDLSQAVAKAAYDETSVVGACGHTLTKRTITSWQWGENLLLVVDRALPTCQGD